MDGNVCRVETDNGIPALVDIGRIWKLMLQAPVVGNEDHSTMKRNAMFTAVLPLAIMAAGCSENTQNNAELAAERAAADAADNAEVLGEELRKGAIVAADKVSEGAASLRDDLTEGEASDTDPSDGQLDGTD